MGGLGGPRGPTPPVRTGCRAGGSKPPTRQHSRANVISLGALPRGPGVTRGAGNAGGAWEGPREGGKGPPPGKGVAHWIFAPGWAEIPNRYATMNWSGK